MTVILNNTLKILIILGSVFFAYHFFFDKKAELVPEIVVQKDTVFVTTTETIKDTIILSDISYIYDTLTVFVPQITDSVASAVYEFKHDHVTRKVFTDYFYAKKQFKFASELISHSKVITETKLITEYVKDNKLGKLLLVGVSGNDSGYTVQIGAGLKYKSVGFAVYGTTNKELGVNLIYFF